METLTDLFIFSCDVSVVVNLCSVYYKSTERLIYDKIKQLVSVAKFSIDVKFQGFKNQFFQILTFYILEQKISLQLANKYEELDFSELVVKESSFFKFSVCNILN